VRTEDLEAFDYFLRGTTNIPVVFGFTDLNGRPTTPERLEMAREYALMAVELDPDFAAGWRLLNHIDGSYLLYFSYLFTEDERLSILERGIAYGQLSRQLSPFEPGVCSCLAAMLLLHGEVEEALLLQEESLRLNPSNATVHGIMAKILNTVGDRARALEEITIARRLSPRDMAMSTYLYIEAEIHEDAGRFDQAIIAANKSLLLAPLNYESEYVKITSLYASGQRELAQAAVARLRRDTPDDFMLESVWHAGFPHSVANKVSLENGESLQGLSYNEGLRLVFEDLGWITKPGSGI
jgi:tetratricopeptide (TPR) repeat protein